MIDLAGVGRVDRRAEEHVRVEIGVNIIAAQIKAQGVGEAELQLRVGGDILITVPLAAPDGGRDAVGAEIGDAHAARSDAARARYIRLGVQRVGIAIVDRRGAAEAFAWRAGHDVDHAADRLTAINDGVGAAQHFDTADIAGQQIAEIIGVADAAGVVHLDPVDQHQRLRRLRAADRNAGDPTNRVGAVEADAGRRDQQVGDADILARLDRLFVDHGHGLPDLVGRLFNAGRGDDDLGRVFGKRGGGGKKRQQRNGGLRHSFVFPERHAT